MDKFREITLRNELVSMIESYKYCKERPQDFLQNYFERIVDEINARAEFLALNSLSESQRLIYVADLTDGDKLLPHKQLLTELGKTQITRIQQLIIIKLYEIRDECLLQASTESHDGLRYESEVEELFKSAHDDLTALQKGRETIYTRLNGDINLRLANLFLNRSVFFRPGILNRLGVLVIFEDLYANPYEIEFSRTNGLFIDTGFKSSSFFELMESFQDLEQLPYQRSFNRNWLILCQLNRYLVHVYDSFYLTNRDLDRQTIITITPHQLALLIQPDVLATGMALRSLAPGAFECLSHITKLDLSKNQIKTINSGIFKPLIHLVLLNMEGNLLEEIGPDMFEGLDELTELLLARNRIKTIQNGDWSGSLPALEGLDLSQNRLVSISFDQLMGLAEISWFNFSDNQINTIECSNAVCFNNLTSIDLSSNLIEKLSEDTRYLFASVQELNLRENPL